MKRKPTRAKIDVAALDAMVEDAIVDSNDESDQVMGLFNMLTEHLKLPSRRPSLESRSPSNASR